MAIPKKGSRSITINGDHYLWRIRHKPTYSQGFQEANLTLAVEKADNPGTTLVVTMPQAHPGNWRGQQPVAVLPSHVKTSIEKAIALGWQPSAPGSPFEFTYF